MPWAFLGAGRKLDRASLLKPCSVAAGARMVWSDKTTRRRTTTRPVVVAAAVSCGCCSCGGGEPPSRAVAAAELLERRLISLPNIIPILIVHLRHGVCSCSCVARHSANCACISSPSCAKISPSICGAEDERRCATRGLIACPRIQCREVAARRGADSMAPP